MEEMLSSGAQDYAKKKEIMANLQQLNMQGDKANTMPSDKGSPQSRKKSHLNADRQLTHHNSEKMDASIPHMKEPSISASSGSEEQDESEVTSG